MAGKKGVRHARSTGLMPEGEAPASSTALGKQVGTNASAMFEGVAAPAGLYAGMDGDAR